jgi:hypothetical protein
MGGQHGVLDETTSGVESDRQLNSCKAESQKRQTCQVGGRSTAEMLDYTAIK